MIKATTKIKELSGDHWVEKDTLLKALIGPLWLEVLEFIEQLKETNHCPEGLDHATISAKAKAVLDKLNVIGKPEVEPDVDWISLAIKNDIVDFINGGRSTSKTCAMLAVSLGESKMFNGDDIQECARKACEWAGIGPEA